MRRFEDWSRYQKDLVGKACWCIVCSEPKKQQWIPSKGIKNQSLAADGVGRVGILYVDLTEEDVEVGVLLKAERFRSSKEIVELTDRYVAEHTANWEVRVE